MTDLFSIDDDHDREMASDGVSRFGSYLRQRRSEFEDFDGFTTDPAEFAAAAWYIASGPVMAPGYVSISIDNAPRVMSATCRQYDGVLIGEATLAVPDPAGLAALTGYTGWDRTYHGLYLEPGEDVPTRRPVMLTTTRVQVPLATHRLHVPVDAPEQVSVTDAKRAVRAVTEVFGDALAPLLFALDSRKYL